LKPIGVVVSGSSPVVVPIHVYKGCENYVKEDAFVVIKDDVKSMDYFGVIRSPRMYDPLLSHYQRSSIIDNPELAKQGREVVFEATIIRVLGVLLPEGQLSPPRQPPTPRSEVYLVESPKRCKSKTRNRPGTWKTQVQRDNSTNKTRSTQIPHRSSRSNWNR